uniref:Ig-like domain-containing protein n=1 Tax=Esox lucius TaxID=8010 RepID=A0AAY5L0T7_ESOLU
MVLYILLMSDCVSVVLGQGAWGVTYSTQSICVLKGSTVEMSCSYTFPSGTVTSTFWYTKDTYKNPVNLIVDSDYTGRVKYHDEKYRHTLTITDLRESDSAVYKFRFITDGDKYTGGPGVTLTLTGLQVKMTAVIVTDGDSVTLTCITTCILIGHTYTWYRNKQVLTNQEVSLYLNPVTSEDAGNYFCAVKGLESLHSPEEKLIVRYGPKNTSVSVSPSGEIMEGSSVTLTCSSDANPPVDKYIWYKKTLTSPKASGQSYSITTIRPEDSGEYYCEAENKYGRLNSMSFSVDVLYGPKNTSVLVSSSGEIVEGSSVTLTCSSDAHPPVDKYAWYKKTVISPKASGQSYSFTNITSEDSGEYYCEAENIYGCLNSMYFSVDVLYGPKTTSVSVSPSGEIVEGSSVTLTCSSDANPPVDKYTWYKKTVTSPKASGQSYNITNITSEDSGEYYCETENKYGRLNSLSVSVDVLWKQTSVLTASVGITVVVLVLILCLSGFICFRKKASKFTADDGQEGVYVNVNISNKTMAPTAQQTAETTDDGEEESVYANVSNMAMTPSAKDWRRQKEDPSNFYKPRSKRT